MENQNVYNVIHKSQISMLMVSAYNARKDGPLALTLKVENNACVTRYSTRRTDTNANHAIRQLRAARPVSTL